MQCSVVPVRHGGADVRGAPAAGAGDFDTSASAAGGAGGNGPAGVRPLGGGIRVARGDPGDLLS